MAYKIILAQQFIDDGHPQDTVLRLMGIPKITFYNKPSNQSMKKGRPCSYNTFKTDGSVVSNEDVVEHIKAILNEEFIDY